MMSEHDNCGTPDCCGQCDTATRMEVIERPDGTRIVTFVPVNKSETPE